MGCTKFTLATCAVLAASMLLSACSIRDETSEEIMVEDQSEEIVLKKPRTKTEFFIQKCIECAAGDMTYLDEIVETYNSSFTNTTDYPPGAFLYQRMSATQAYESCALKALLEGHEKPFDNIIVRPNRIARIARYFYAFNQPTQGAYWLQRIVNIRGEVAGLEVAGRVFIQDMRTIGIGVQLLEQSARLGNRAAGQMLTGLMTPGSPYYTQLTTNNTNDYTAKDRTETEKQADDIGDAKNNLEALINQKKKEREKGTIRNNIISTGQQPGKAAAVSNQLDNFTDSKGSVINVFNSEDKKKKAAPSRSGPAAKQTAESSDVTEAKSALSDYRDDIEHSTAPATAPATAPDATAPASATTQDKPEAAVEPTPASTAEPVAPEAASAIPAQSSSSGYGLPGMPAAAQTEDALQSNDAELDIPLEFYENKKADATAGADAATDAGGSAGDADLKVTKPTADKDINEAHKRLVERHEERLKQAKERAEAAAAAAERGTN